MGVERLQITFDRRVISDVDNGDRLAGAVADDATEADRVDAVGRLDLGRGKTDSSRRT